MNSKDLVKQMTLEEKASLCSGQNFWQLKALERLGLPSIMVTDGPHGLRKQAGSSDHLGISESVEATCFPTAVTTACSFDRALLSAMGEALGEECLQEDVAVLLGPGANIKRSPLCGRNFEYISEDPYLTGELAAALIQGVQSKGVGTSLKHFAANNQETRRMSTNSVVDERALHEIYLTGFEKAVKQGKPWTVMCSYNLLNGFYMSENHELLTEFLRDDWGFEGLVVTDWGAVCNRVTGIKSGLDLEMPGSGGYNDGKIVQAVQDGTLDEAALDIAAERVVSMMLRAKENRREGYTYDAAAHHALACRAAAESAVLLKNEENILPLQADASVAVIGEFAKTPRYQGAGSSRINPAQLDCAFDALTARGIAAEYAPGYVLKDKDEANLAALREEACRIAQDQDIVLLFAGLPDAYESEGFDRVKLELPPEQNELIEAVAAVNPNVVVLLQCGSPVLLPWADKVKGILLCYLGGQAGGSAAAQLLLGESNPGGKLAESFPIVYTDAPSCGYFPGGQKSVEYRESIFVGYRYYDTAKKAVAYPFGYGLSYTSFSYSDLKLSADSYAGEGEITAEFTVTNTGACAGAEIVQIYVGRAGESEIFRCEKELKGFDKVFLQPGESQTVRIALDARAFSYYNAPAECWAIEGGAYTVSVGASSRDIRLTATVQVTGDGKEAQLAYLKDAVPTYFNLPQGVFTVSDAEYTALYGDELPPSEREDGEPYTMNSTLADIKDTMIGKPIYLAATQKAAEMAGDNEAMKRMVESMVLDMPLRSLVVVSQGAFSYDMLEEILTVIGGNPLKAMGAMMSLMRKMKKQEKEKK